MTKNTHVSSKFGLVPERTARRNRMEELIMERFHQYGYSEVALPIYEYHDVLKETVQDFDEGNVISFIDRSSGRSLVLRPDFTPQVCRMIAGYAGDFATPVRVYYRGTVFRNVSINEGAKAEKLQIGCELLGTDELSGDLELFLCLNRIIKDLKLTDLRIVIGDSAYMQRLATLLGDIAPKYFKILAGKRLYEVNSFFEDNQIDANLVELLKELPMVFGDRSELDRLANLSLFDAVLSGRCKYLTTLFDKAVAYGLSDDMLVFDAGETRGQGYYTGISFDVLHIPTGASIGGGGRYDTLPKKFNINLNACGMGLYLGELDSIITMDANDKAIDYLVIGRDTFLEAEQLRDKGYTVVQIYEKTALKSCKEKVKFNNIIGD